MLHSSGNRRQFNTLAGHPSTSLMLYVEVHRKCHKFVICRRQHFICASTRVHAMPPTCFKPPFSLLKTFHPVKALGGGINGIGPDGCGAACNHVRH